MSRRAEYLFRVRETTIFLVLDVSEPPGYFVNEFERVAWKWVDEVDWHYLREPMRI